jgi:hypothetical protein
MDKLLLLYSNDGSVQRYGREVIAAAVWMASGLVLKHFVDLPLGLVFSVPYILSRSWSLTHVVFPVRVAEWRMGRCGFKRLLMYVMAHATGYLIGLVLYSIIPMHLGISLDSVFVTKELVGSGSVSSCVGTACSSNGSKYAAKAAATAAAAAAGGSGGILYSLPGVVVDILASCLYCIVLLVLPEIVLVNKKPLYLVTLCLAAIVVAHSYVCHDVIDFPQSSMLNPISSSVLQFGSWISSTKINSAAYRQYTTFNIAGVDPFADIKGTPLLAVPLALGVLRNILSPGIVDRFAGTMIGAMVGGTLCNSWFPDDAHSWMPWRQG